jgi:hypothetical protein
MMKYTQQDAEPQNKNSVEISPIMHKLGRHYFLICTFLQEVEADKQNAAKLNALVQVTSPTEDWPIGRRSPPHSQGTSSGVCSEQKGPQQNNGSSGDSAKCYTLEEVRNKQRSVA